MWVTPCDVRVFWSDAADCDDRSKFGRISTICKSSFWSITKPQWWPGKTTMVILKSTIQKLFSVIQLETDPTVLAELFHHCLYFHEIVSHRWSLWSSRSDEGLRRWSEKSRPKARSYFQSGHTIHQKREHCALNIHETNKIYSEIWSCKKHFTFNNFGVLKDINSLWTGMVLLSKKCTKWLVQFIFVTQYWHKTLNLYKRILRHNLHMKSTDSCHGYLF